MKMKVLIEYNKNILKPTIIDRKKNRKLSETGQIM